MSSASYRDLDVWQKAMDLVTECYKITAGFPKDEAYGLVSQLRRAAVSIPANIAEGQARQHTAEFAQFLSIAYGSLAELETHILIAARLHYTSQETADALLQTAGRVGRMMNGLRKAVLAKAKDTGARVPTTDN